jgi:hypothetical protein
MRHRDLDASGIRTLVNDEMSVDSADDSVRQLWDEIERLVLRQYARGKKLSQADMQTMFRDCDSFTLAAFHVVDARYREIGPTRARPKSGALDVSYTVVLKSRKRYAGLDSLYRLYNLRLAITPKVVKLELHPLNVAFLYHAAERLVERAAAATLPFEALAAELADWSWLIQEASETSATKLDYRLSLPTTNDEGMLLGEYVRLPLVHSYTMKYNKIGARQGILGHPSDYEINFIVRTFVDRHQLRPAQRYAMNLLSEFRRDHEDEYMKARDRTLDVDLPESERRHPLLAPETYTKLRRILDDATVLRAMHPDKLLGAHRAEDAGLPLGRWGDRPGAP